MDQPYKRLYRSQNNKMIAGVCSGLAKYFNMDPSWVRLLFILFFFLGGSAILVYVLMWIIVPQEPTSVS